MPGLATNFVILDQVIDRLAGSADPKLQHAAQVIQNQRAYAYLGAVGPSLADFIPSDPPPPNTPSTGGSPYTAIWMQILAITGGDGTPNDPGMMNIIKTLRDFLDKIVPIADAEDLGALSDIKDSGELDQVTTMAENLKTLVDGLLPKVAAIGAGISAGMKPRVNVGVGTTVPLPPAWTAREFLHWKHPGKFATSLLADALASNDERFIAYAYGYLSSFAGQAAGQPFINSVIGGAYRPQWWRTRWVNNYVDAWTHGCYGCNATMAGDTPTPPYDQWPGLCDAKLQDKISIGAIDPVDVMAKLRASQPFPAVLPDDFADFWINAWHKAYDPQPISRFRKETLNGAYVMTWMKLWFETGGEVIGCNPQPPASPPGDCGGKPGWVDPANPQPGENGQNQTPPAPTFEHDPDVAEIVTGVILALLGGASLFFGGGVAGLIAIGAGIALIVDGSLQFTWDELRCDLYWYRWYLYNGLTALHNLITLGGFSHPYPNELAQDTTTISLLNTPYKFDSGMRVVKSRQVFRHGDDTGYPSKAWSGGLGTWPNRPTGADPGWEQDYTSTCYHAVYPTFWIDDDAANPLTADNDVKTGGAWPPGYRTLPGSDFPVQFSNAVANAIDMIANPGIDLPDWNLDADRGAAALTWQFVQQLYTDPVKIEPEP